MTIKKAHVAGFVFSSLLGTLLHFVFEWSGYAPAVGALSAVNESIWEHLKLLVIPMLLFGVIEYFIYGKEQKNFITLRFLSILLGMAVITVGYYTYSGILGRDVMAVNIILFELGLLTAYVFSYRRMETERFRSGTARSWSLLGLAALLAAFIIFTYYPPHIGIFQDPMNYNYGIEAAE